MSNPGFGALTIKVKLADGSYGEVKLNESGADENVNGKIDTQAEFDTLVDYIESKYGQGVADSFNFQSLASLKTNDGKIDADELQIWSLVEQINDAYNDKLAFLAGDTFFSGNAGLMYQMRDHLEEFKNNYINTIQPETLATDLDNAVVRFGEAINAEYDNFKAELQRGIWITNSVVHMMSQNVFASLSQQEYGRVYNKIAEEARRYLDENPNATERGLDSYLEQWLEQDFLRSYVDNNNDLVNWNSALATCQTDDYIDLVSELPTLKSIAKQLINRAYDCDITFVKNGHEITKETLIAQINSYNSEADAEKLVNLITFINEAIDSAYRNDSSRANLLAQGVDKIRIDITTAEVLPNQVLDENAANMIIRDVVDGLLSNYDDSPREILQALSELLGNKANEFYRNVFKGKKDDFEQALNDYLYDYICHPMSGIYSNLENYWNENVPFGFDIEYSTEDGELAFLKDMFRHILSVAANYHITIVDSEGNTINNINNFLNKFDKYNANELLGYINRIMSFLEDFDPSLLTLLGNNGGASLNVNVSIDGVFNENSIGEIDHEGAMTTIGEVIDAVMNRNCPSNVPAEIRQKVYERLELLANKFLEGYHGTNLAQFSEDLYRELEETYFRNPLCDIKNAVNGILDTVNGINVEDGCSDNELAELKAQFNNLLAAMGSDIILCDANGEALTVNLNVYNKTNAKELKNLIKSIADLIGTYNKDIVQLYTQNEDGVLKIYIVNGKAQWNKPEAPTTDEDYNAIMNGDFGPYDYDTVYAAIRKEANTWGMTLYNDLFKQAFETVANKLTIVGDLIYCEPNKLAKKVKEEYENLADKKDDEIINAPLDESQFDSGNDNISWWRNRESQKSRFDSSLKPQLRNKARALCNKYGKTFNETIFKQIYESARDYEINLVWFAFSGWNVSEKRLAGMIKSEFIKNYEDAIK